MNLLVSMRYLVALGEHKHFARAAQACFITQPALSNALRALETEFGVPIVKRGRSFVGFTEEGYRLLESARRMLFEEQLLKQDFSSQGQRIKGTLSIGVVPAAEPIAARFAAQLHVLHPGISPVVRSMNSHDIEAGLVQLTIDLGLGFTERVQQAWAQTFRTFPQYNEHYYLVRTHILPDVPQTRSDMLMGSEMSWAQASQLPLCLMTSDMHNRQIVDRAFRQAGVSVVPALQTNSMLSLAMSALGGKLACILPGALLVLVQPYGQLSAHRLIDPEVTTALGFMVPGLERYSRTQEAAMALAQDADWLKQAAEHSGMLHCVI
jgi:DNA-binding transcriptional LysR family regulator